MAGTQVNYLPWRVLESDPSQVVDSAGCLVINLNLWGTIGRGHEAQEIAQLIVEAANRKQVDNEMA